MLPRIQEKATTTPTSIYKYIRTTDKSSLFRNKPRRPDGSPQRGRTRQRGWAGGRAGGGGRADPVSRCRFPLKITKRDLFFRTASGWERTLTTQNSFTNVLVLSFPSLGPQISLPDPSAYSALAGNGACTGQVGGSSRAVA